MCPLTKQEIISYLKNELPEEKRIEVRKIILDNSDCQKQVNRIKKQLKKDEAKRIMLPHSKAKVDMFSQYLTRYLSILTLVSYVRQINIFDLFCGRGFYENDEEGSPIRAFRIIRDIQSRLIRQKKRLKPIHFLVNDEIEEFVAKIKEFISSENKPNVFQIFPTYENLTVEKLFPKVISQLESQGGDEKNLIFIDPYGYKEIHKSDIQQMLINDHTEIILFLPISQMHRFKKVAVKDEENMHYAKLRDFINEFFNPDHPVSKGEGVSSFEFINYIKEALSFNNTYFSTSFYIERDSNKNVYALFFITPNIKGFEKILESKWELDENEGRMFRMSESGSLFQKSYTNDYEEKLINFIKEEKRNNTDLYVFGLRNNHLPKHTNKILKKWKMQMILDVFDIDTGLVNKKGLYLSERDPKVYFHFKG